LLSAWARRGSAIAGGRHRLYLSLPIIAAVAAWLTQALRSDKDFALGLAGVRSLVFQVDRGAGRDASAAARRLRVKFPPLRRRKRRLGRLCAKTRKSHKESGGPRPLVRRIKRFTRAPSRCAGCSTGRMRTFWGQSLRSR